MHTSWFRSAGVRQSEFVWNIIRCKNRNARMKGQAAWMLAQNVDFVLHQETRGTNTVAESAFCVSRQAWTNMNICFYCSAQMLEHTNTFDQFLTDFCFCIFGFGQAGKQKKTLSRLFVYGVMLLLEPYAYRLFFRIQSKLELRDLRCLVTVAKL